MPCGPAVACLPALPLPSPFAPTVAGNILPANITVHTVCNTTYHSYLGSPDVARTRFPFAEPPAVLVNLLTAWTVNAPPTAFTLRAFVTCRSMDLPVLPYPCPVACHTACYLLNLVSL